GRGTLPRPPLGEPPLSGSPVTAYRQPTTGRQTFAETGSDLVRLPVTPEIDGTCTGSDWVTEPSRLLTVPVTVFRVLVTVLVSPLTVGIEGIIGSAGSEIWGSAGTLTLTCAWEVAAGVWAVAEAPVAEPTVEGTGRTPPGRGPAG